MLSLLSHPAATAFGLTLLHALWQVALVAGLVALLHTQLTSARTRYATALGGLLLLPLIAVATFYASYTPVTPTASVDATQWLALLDTADAATDTTDTTATAATDWRSWLPYLTAAYLLGLCLFALRLAGSGLRLYFLRRRGIRPVGSLWQERMTQLNRRYAIRPSARLYLSERVNQVLSFGHFKPLILFPVGLLNQLDPTEVEAILLHELAHLQRRDYLWNWIQSAVETAYFFHPASYWLGSRIRHERECCCDDWVAQRTDKTIYAQSLIHLARFAQTPTNQLAMYANAPRSPLGQRIERLFQPATRRRSVLPLLLFLIPFALLAWQPLQETKTEEPALETLVARNDRAAEPDNELLELIELAPEPSPSAALPTATAPDRQPAGAYDLIPRELSFLPVTENRIPRVRLSPITPSFPTLGREISPLALPAPVPAVDTVPDQSGTFHPETLFIVDGKRLPRGSADPLDKLDPEDIISVNVYKGTSAVDRFGDDTEQGVIVITTRRGNESRSRKAGAPIDEEPKDDFEMRVQMRNPAGQQAEPRYVVDGEMLPEGQALEVEPDEIESITVWKGEKATERYGATGENGVIDIKTKTGPDQRTPAPDAPIHLDADKQKTKIRIRSSEQQQPLFIVDGKMQPKGTAQPADLSPEEIESVEVVKGKAAVERFGSDARDGAVLIQTKAAAKLLDKATRKEGKKLRLGPNVTAGDPDLVYVIDGVIQPDASAVENLDKNDIAQVNVMKDEPARAVFGEAIGDRTVVEIILKKTPPPPPPTRPTSPPSVTQPAVPAAPAPTTPPVPAPQPMAAPQYLSSTLYPNPTSGATQVRFNLDREEQVVLDVFNAEGRRVLNRSFGRLPAGTQQLEFDAADLPAGTYTVTILAGAQRWKATLVRP